MARNRKVERGQVRRVRWVGKDSHYVLVENSLVKKEVWDGMLSRCDSQFFCRQSSGWNLRTFSRSCRKTSQWNALDTLYLPLRGLLLCPGVITVNPALATSDNPGTRRLHIRAWSDEAPRRRWHAAASDQPSEIASGQIHDSKQRDVKWAIFYTGAQDMLVLSSTTASHYNCCTDGSTSPGIWGQPMCAL
jgi:hypothetical protein